MTESCDDCSATSQEQVKSRSPGPGTAGQGTARSRLVGEEWVGVDLLGKYRPGGPGDQDARGVARIAWVPSEEAYRPVDGRHGERDTEESPGRRRKGETRTGDVLQRIPWPSPGVLPLRRRLIATHGRWRVASEHTDHPTV